MTPTETFSPGFRRPGREYGMLNGRGYPDTINTTANFPLNENGDWVEGPFPDNGLFGAEDLLRISNLSFDFYTLTVQGIPLRVVGKDAKLRRGPTGLTLVYTTSAIDLGGGQFSRCHSGYHRDRAGDLPALHHHLIISQ